MESQLKKSGFTLIELLVVVGIFGLIIGVSFTLLSGGRLSVEISEARIQAAECSRRAMNRIVRELRLSRASRVRLYDDLNTEGPAISGEVVYFQVPVLTAGGDLDITISGELTWGT